VGDELLDAVLDGNAIGFRFVTEQNAVPKRGKCESLNVIVRDMGSAKQ
jgi:hypothetical protein